MTNDTDPDGTGAVCIASGGSCIAALLNFISAQGGSVDLNVDGTFTYTPPMSFVGIDTFTYAINDIDANDCLDAVGTATTATASIAVTNETPVANAQMLSVNEDTMLPITLTGSDADLDDLTFSITTGPTNGTLSVVTNVPDNSMSSDSATVTYTPTANFNGSDSFTFQVDDGNGGLDTASVDISIDPQQDLPTANAMLLMVNEDTVLPITLTGSDIDLDDLTFSITTGPTNGTLSVVTNVADNGMSSDSATLTYTPTANFNGSDSFTFQVDDGNGNTNTADVDITVDPINDAPSITLGGNQSVAEDAGAQSVASFATGFAPGGGTDEAGQAILDYVVSNDNNSLFTTQPDIDTAGALTYTPAANANGIATVTVQVQDDGSTANGGVDLSVAQMVTITVTAVNNAPSITLGGNQNVAEDAVAQSVASFATGFAPGGGTDEAGQAILNFVVSNNNNSLFTTQPDIDTAGTLTYTPAANASGIATVTVQVQDDGGTANGGVDLSVAQMVTITVTPVNDPPVVSAPGPFMSNANMRLTVADGASDLLANANDTIDTSVSGTSIITVSQAMITTLQNGTVTINQANGSFTYDPPSGFTGADTFMYTVVDDGVGPPATQTSIAATVTINVQSTDMSTAAGAPVIWFIDNSVAGSDVGTLENPFLSIAAYETARMAGTVQAGDFVYIEETGTNYTSGLTLLNTQSLIGEGASATLETITLIETLSGNNFPLPATGGTNPIITTTNTNAITLGSGNTIRGLTIGNTGAGAGISGNTVGALSISEASITGTGQAVDINGGALAVSFDSLSSTSSTTAVNLNGVSGTCTAPAGAISGATGTAFNVTGGTVSATYSGSITQANNAATVSVNGGHNTGTVTFNTGTVSATNGPGLQFNNADGTYNFTGTTTLSGGDAGIDILNGSAGMFTFGSTTSITNPSGMAFNAENSTANIDYLGSITQNNTATGVRLSANTDTATFRGGLNLNTGTATAFTATGGGILNVCATTDCAGGAAVVNTIGATTPVSGTAVNISNTTIGTNNVTFRSIDANAGNTATTAIILDDTGAGTFSVTGDGTTSSVGTQGGNGSGGTIENIQGADAITLNNTDGRVTFQNMIIQDISDANDATAAIQTRSGRDAIQGENVDGGLTIESSIIRRTSDNGIHGRAFAGGPATNFNGLEILNSLLENAGRFHVMGRGDDGAQEEGLVTILGMTGTVRVDNSRFTLGGHALSLVSPSGAGNLDMTVQRSTFVDLYKEFVCSGGTVNVGERGITVQVEGSHDAVVRIGDPAETDPALGNTFTNNATASIVVNGQEGGATPHTGDIDAVISQNTFRVTDHLTGPAGCPGGTLTFNFPQGGVSLNPSGGTFEAIVSNNLFDQVMHAAGGFGQLTIGTLAGNGASEFIVRDNEFRLPWDATVVLRAEANNSATILFDGNTYTDGVVGGASDDVGFSTQSPFQGFLVNVRNGGSMDLTVQNEVLPQQDDVNGGGTFTFIAEVQNQAGNTLDLYIDNTKSPDGYQFTRTNGTFRLFRENIADTTAVTIMDGNGNTGGNGMSGVPNPAVNGDNTDPPVVLTTGTITPTDTAPTLPNITIP